MDDDDNDESFPSPIWFKNRCRSISSQKTSSGLAFSSTESYQRLTASASRLEFCRLFRLAWRQTSSSWNDDESDGIFGSSWCWYFGWRCGCGWSMTNPFNGTTIATTTKNTNHPSNGTTVQFRRVCCSERERERDRDCTIDDDLVGFMGGFCRSIIVWSFLQ